MYIIIAQVSISLGVFIRKKKAKYARGGKYVNADGDYFAVVERSRTPADWLQEVTSGSFVRWRTICDPAVQYFWVGFYVAAGLEVAVFFSMK